MLFKTFKQKIFIDTLFMITVQDLATNTFYSFKVNYITGENINKVIELYEKKAKMKSVCFNKAVGMNEISVTI